MQITFHGKFAKDYGSNHVIEASSITEAIDGLSRQLGFYTDRFLEDRPVARVVGYNTLDSFEECPERIDIVPAIQGGKGAGKILIGAALIGLSFVTAGAASPFVAGLLTNTLFGIGVSLALAGVAQMFTKAPSLSKETDPEASKYLGLSNNTTKLGTLRSYSMGRIKLTAPHLLALNVDSNDLVRGEFPA
jgi:predicted phage tail protein